uniref:Uncharacterized protein n=1 Tax=Takifugu rubripes TaxID=31033 RepID=A0A674NFR1_TAKRU
MEVSRRRVLQKHLEPARPLRRCVNLHFVGKLSYSRDFLISLANCAESRKKPEFLPDYSIVLTKAVSLASALL